MLISKHFMETCMAQTLESLFYMVCWFLKVDRFSHVYFTSEVSMLFFIWHRNVEMLVNLIFF